MPSSSFDIFINGHDRSKAAFFSAERNLRRISRVASVAGAAVASYFSIETARRTIEFLHETVRLASDAEESASKLGQVFGDATETINRRLDAFSFIAGRSRFELREAAGDFGALLVPMGLTEDAAGDLSVQLTKLATDLASFFNTSDEQAKLALRSGLVGESEPLRKYGVQLSALRIKQEAFASGIGRTGEELTAAEKAQAAFNIIMADTAKAQGDAIRTADGYANAVRNLQGDIKDLKTELGQQLLPVVSEGLSLFNQWIDVFGGMSNAAKVAFTQIRADAAELLQYVPQAFISDLVGFTNFYEQADEFRAVANETLLQVGRDAKAQAVQRRAVAAGEAAGRGGSFPFVGPLLPDGGLQAFRDGLNADAPVKVELVNDAGLGSPFTAGPTGPGAGVSGNLITGLAQIGGSVNIQKKMLDVAERSERSASEARDILRQINQNLGSGQAVIVGAFNR